MIKTPKKRVEIVLGKSKRMSNKRYMISKLLTNGYITSNMAKKLSKKNTDDVGRVYVALKKVM